MVNGEHAYQTVVVDSGDWLERLIHANVAAKAGVAAIENIDYGKGYKAAITEWGRVIAKLDDLRVRRGMAVIVINHSTIKRFDSPEVEPYDRFTMKLHESATALLTEWADVIGFACKDTYVMKEDVGFNKKVARGVTSGKRVLRLEGAPAYVAGNRYGLPASVELNWQAFVTAFNRSPRRHTFQNPATSTLSRQASISSPSTRAKRKAKTARVALPMSSLSSTGRSRDEKSSGGGTSSFQARPMVRRRPRASVAARSRALRKRAGRLDVVTPLRSMASPSWRR